MSSARFGAVPPSKSLVPCGSLAAQQRDHGVVPEIAPYVAWCNWFRAPGTLDGMTLALAIGLADSNWPLERLPK